MVPRFPRPSHPTLATLAVAAPLVILLACGEPSFETKTAEQARADTPVPAEAPLRTLALYGAKAEAHCAESGPPDWKVQRGLTADGHGFRQRANSVCVLRPPLPSHSQFHFRVWVAPPGKSLRVRVSTANSPSGAPTVLFEKDLTEETQTYASAVDLPADAREIRLETRSTTQNGAQNLAAAWTSLRLETRTSGELIGNAWSVPLRTALSDFYAAEDWPRQAPHSKRLLVIGIDGASWPLLDELIEADALPTLERLKASGTFGVLESSVIPESAMGWASMRTGVDPGEHGVFGFGSPDRSAPSYWRMLAAYGLSSVVLAVPDAPLRRPFDGVFVGGWTHDLSDDYVEPPALRRALARARYNPTLVKLRNAFDYNERTRARTELARSLLGQVAWDHAFVVYEYADGAGHRLGLRSEGWRATLMEIDTQIGRLLESIGPETLVLVVSDHGWADYQGTVALGPWLSSRGFFSWKVSMWAGNRVGIEPRRSLPPAVREKQRRRLTARLRALREAPDGELLVAQVIPGELAFSGPYAGPDRGLLIVELADGFRAAQHEQRALVKRYAAEHHASEGIYLLAGPLIEAGTGPTASILDVAPTALRYLGVPQPATLEGKPLHAFGPPRFAARSAEEWALEAGEATDPGEMPEHLKESLRALGYME